MGFKDSKSVRILKEYGIKPFMSHCLHKSIKSLNRRSIFVLLQFYPKIVLDKSQFKTFKLAYQHFEENYRNIIAISPSFFIKNLKKHIAWLESDIFKNQYGDVENLENISKNTIGATSFSIQKDSKINTFTPPPPHCVKLNAMKNLAV